MASGYIFSGKLIHSYQLSNNGRFLWVKSENYSDEIVMIKTQNHASNQGKRNKFPILLFLGVLPRITTPVLIGSYW